MLSEHGPLDVVIHVGMQGLAGYLVPVMLLLCGILLWFTPAQRPFYSLFAIVLSLGSWLTSNLGGFFLGMALGLVGGTLAFAWSTSSDEPIQWPRSYPQILQPSAVLGMMLRQPSALPSGRPDESVVVLESASLAPPARPLAGAPTRPWSAELNAPELKAPGLNAPDLMAPDLMAPDLMAADLMAADLMAADPMTPGLAADRAASAGDRAVQQDQPALRQEAGDSPR